VRPDRETRKYAMDGQTCEGCRFWICGDQEPDYDVGEPWAGSCCRYPRGELKLAREWCGEYQPTTPATFSEQATALARHVLLGDMTAARALADKLKEDGQ
jgi:hypothetical protein